MFESSLTDHLGRKSLKITYKCRFCSQTKIFYNRCRLLFHIRSHAFKTATINVNDLMVEPLPLGFYKEKIIQKAISPTTENIRKSHFFFCHECKKTVLSSIGTAYKDRASHFMQYTNEVHSCPVCLFVLPTVCGLRAHLRFHLIRPPFFCPECGVHLPGKTVHYPYAHDCEGFKMMRATARIQCPLPNCYISHPNDFKDHMKEKHFKKVKKCPYCLLACFDEETMNVHLQEHNVMNPISLQLFQCQLCPGKLVNYNNIDSHLRHHPHSAIFPCWTCSSTFKNVAILLQHHLQKHKISDHIAIKNLLNPEMNLIGRETQNQSGNKDIYRVIKRCDQCQRDFTYKCNFNDISVLPSECPFKCQKSASLTTLTCHLCKEKFSDDWETIKKHYATNHRTHKCLDIKVVLERIDISKYKKMRTVRNVKAKKGASRKRAQITKTKVNEQKSVKTLTSEGKVPGTYCTICEYTCEGKEQLETHFISHKDSCMAYQCMECGQNFVVKPSFSTHLMLEHSISNADEYILNKNQCYNENALERYQNSNVSLEPLRENQCKICREQFESSEDLTKHFRGHGMAFLLKSTSNKNTS